MSASTSNYNPEQAMREAGQRYREWLPRLREPSAGQAGYGVPDPRDPKADWLSDGYDTPAEAAAAAREALWRATGNCTCEWEEDEADPEVGPRASISEVDEQCPVHGREADPQGWAEGEAMERYYILSGMAGLLKPKGVDVSADEELALAFWNYHYQRQPQPDDGHNTDRACTDAAATVAALHARGDWPPKGPRPCTCERYGKDDPDCELHHPEVREDEVAATAKAIEGMCADWEAGRATSPDEADYLWAAAEALGEGYITDRTMPRWRDLASELYWQVCNGKLGNEGSNAEATMALATEAVRLVREGKPWWVRHTYTHEVVGTSWGTTPLEALAAYSTSTGFADPRDAEDADSANLEHSGFFCMADGTLHMVYTNYSLYAEPATGHKPDPEVALQRRVADGEATADDNACGRCDRVWAPGLKDAQRWGVYHPANDLWLCPACLDSMAEGEAAAAEHAADNEQPLALSLRLDDVADLFEAVGYLASIDEGEYTVTERLDELGKLLAKQVPGGITTLLRNGEGVTK